MFGETKTVCSILLIYSIPFSLTVLPIQQTGSTLLGQFVFVQLEKSKLENTSQNLS